MKKSLVALAALAATSAFAQSAVSITGYFDRGYTSVSNSDGTKNLKTISSSAGTTQINFNFRDDLGGGNALVGKVETDWSDLASNTQANGTSSAQNSGFANSENYLGATGGFGTVRLGTPNTYTLTNQTAVATPLFSTAVGSVDSSQYSLFNGVGTGTVGFGGVVTADTSNTAANKVTAGSRDIRIANTIQYQTPTFNGFYAAVGYTPQNNNATASNGSGNTVGVTEYALRYTKGPLDAMYTNIKYSVGSNGTSYQYYALASGVMGLQTKNLAGGYTNTHSLASVNYAVLPNLKLNGGYGKFSSSDNGANGTSYVVGGTYTVGAFDLMLLTSKVTDNNGANTAYQNNRSMTGLGVNYNLSKLTRVYVRYDNINYNPNATFAGSTQNRTAIGLSTNF